MWTVQLQPVKDNDQQLMEQVLVQLDQETFHSVKTFLYCKLINVEVYHKMMKYIEAWVIHYSQHPIIRNHVRCWNCPSYPWPDVSVHVPTDHFSSFNMRSSDRSCTIPSLSTSFTQTVLRLKTSFAWLISVLLLHMADVGMCRHMQIQFAKTMILKRITACSSFLYRPLALQALLPPSHSGFRF